MVGFVRDSAGSGIEGATVAEWLKANNFEPPSIPGETGSPSNNELHILNDQVAGGLTYSPTTSTAIKSGNQRLRSCCIRSSPRPKTVR